MRSCKIAVAMLAALLPLLCAVQQNKVFYTIGSAEHRSADSSSGVRLYEVDSTNLRIVRFRKRRKRNARLWVGKSVDAVRDVDG
jgi:hypothetical protein